MEKKITQLIEQIAKQLGTTVEYLWSILIKQAFISAITDICLIVFVLVTGIILVKVHRKYMIRNDIGDTMYDRREWVTMIMISLGTIWVVLAVFCAASIPDTITALFNPEYWALKHILNQI